MNKVNVHPRIAEHSPEISPQDVSVAMRSMNRYVQMPRGEWLAVGSDAQGRLIELAYVYDAVADSFTVFHAATPPSVAVLKELGLGR